LPGTYAVSRVIGWKLLSSTFPDAILSCHTDLPTLLNLASKKSSIPGLEDPVEGSLTKDGSEALIMIKKYTVLRMWYRENEGIAERISRRISFHYTNGLSLI
jgi:hypothetical protein